MCKSVLITISYFGSSTDNYFSLYSNVDSYAVPFQTGVTKTSLLTGHTSHQVPDSATTIKVKPELGNCISLFSEPINIPSPTPTPTATPTPTPATPTPTPTPTGTPTPTPTATPTPTPLPYVSSNLELYLDAGVPASYPTTGSTWLDLTTNDRDSTLRNGPSYSSSNGGSIVFNGTTQYADILRNSLTFGSNVSWSMWFKTSKTTGVQRIFSNWETSGSDFVFLWQINAGKLDGQVRNTLGNDMVPTIPTITISANTIYNVVITWDASVNEFKIYNNKVLVSTLTGATPSDLTIKTPTGTLMYLATAQTSNYLQGNIYQIMEYSKTLSLAEVTQNYDYFKLRYT